MTWPARSAGAGLCASTAGLRVHGTTAQRPAEHFAAEEAHRLLPAPTTPYDVPIFATPKVARDHHMEVARGLYSVAAELIGQRVAVRADSALVKIFAGGQLVKTHPRVRPGGRSTDAGDYPTGRAELALRDVATLTAKAGDPMNPTLALPLLAADGDPPEELARALSLLEDWLTHASDEALDELAEFAPGPGPAGAPDRPAVAALIELLGLTAARLRPACRTANPGRTDEPHSSARTDHRRL